MKLLITGGCGFLGSNLARAALAKGLQLCVLDDLSRTGSRENLAWLQEQGADFDFVAGDIADAAMVVHLVETFRPEAVFHLAGQVAMTTSLRDPYRDFQVNAQGTVNLLEALRHHCPRAALVYASTNKVYGELARHEYVEGATRYTCPDRPNGFGEDEPLDFHSPYGCSKGAADQYCLDYARNFGLRTVVLRHSSMYGARQFATEDQGWVGWFCSLAARHAGPEPLATTISGNGKQVRDILHADDAAELYFACLDALPRLGGRAFNVGGGMANSLSLMELFALIESLAGCHFRLKHLPARASDQNIFVADTATLHAETGWAPRIGAADGIAAMLAWGRERAARAQT